MSRGSIHVLDIPGIPDVAIVKAAPKMQVQVTPYSLIGSAVLSTTTYVAGHSSHWPPAAVTAAIIGALALVLQPLITDHLRHRLHKGELTELQRKDKEINRLEKRVERLEGELDRSRERR